MQRKNAEIEYAYMQNLEKMMNETEHKADEQQEQANQFLKMENEIIRQADLNKAYTRRPLTNYEQRLDDSQRVRLT